MKSTERLLLYRINKSLKTVELLQLNEEESEQSAANKSEIRSYGFDATLHDVMSFRISYQDYENDVLKIMDVIDTSKKTVDEMIASFESKYMNNQNFFTSYYAHLHHRLFLRTRENILKKFVYNFSLSKAKKTSKGMLEKIRSLISELDALTNNKNCCFIRRIKCDKYYIKKNGQFESYNIADESLTNLMYDVSDSIHELRLHPCTCKYCCKYFWGKLNDKVCNSDFCQSTYKHDSKNEERCEKNHRPYNYYRKKLSDYIGQQKTRLPEIVLDDQELINKWDSQRKVFTKKMDDKIEEYEIEGRLPDKELDSFYEQMKQEVKDFAKDLVKEAYDRAKKQ